MEHMGAEHIMCRLPLGECTQSSSSKSSKLLSATCYLHGAKACYRREEAVFSVTFFTTAQQLVDCQYVVAIIYSFGFVSGINCMNTYAYLIAGVATPASWPHWQCNIITMNLHYLRAFHLGQEDLNHARIFALAMRPSCSAWCREW